MTSIVFIIDFITYLSVFCFVFHLKLKKSVLHISLGCVWAVLGSCFLYLYSPDFSYRIIILFGLYLLFQAKLDHILVCFSLYTLISYLTECYGIYFYSLLTGTNVLDNPLILSLCRIFVSLFFLLLCTPVLPRHSDHFPLFPALCEKQPVHFRPLFSTSGSDGNTKRLF